MPTFDPADRDPVRTDDQARKRFLGVLNRSLSVVCKDAIWRVAPLGDGRFSAITSTDQAVALRVSDYSRLFLRSTIQFVYDDDERLGKPERKVCTLYYAHTVGATEALKPQFYSWEWSASEPTYPHLHVRRGDPEYQGLGKLHIPTGRVFYEDVLWFLVKEHDVVPRMEESKAHAVLSEGLRRVTSFATWGGGLRPELPD